MNPESSDVNIRVNYISGNVPLASNYTSARATNMDKLNQTFPSGADYTAVRAGYLDYLKYHTGITYVGYGASADAGHDGNSYYTVTAGKVLVITSISFSLGQNSANSESQVSLGLSGTTELYLTQVHSGSNWSMGDWAHSCTLPLNHGIYVPAGSKVHSFATQITGTGDNTYITFNGYEVNA